MNNVPINHIHVSIKTSDPSIIDVSKVYEVYNTLAMDWGFREEGTSTLSRGSHINTEIAGLPKSITSITDSLIKLSAVSGFERVTIVKRTNGIPCVEFFFSDSMGERERIEEANRYYHQFKSDIQYAMFKTFAPKVHDLLNKLTVLDHSLGYSVNQFRIGTLELVSNPLYSQYSFMGPAAIRRYINEAMKQSCDVISRDDYLRTRVSFYETESMSAKLLFRALKELPSLIGVTYVDDAQSNDNETTTDFQVIN